jgi:fatty-acyl-CoA synthase
VAIWATNHPEWIVTQFGSAKAGAVLVTVNTNYRAYELEYLLKQSEVTTLILIDGHRDVNYVDMINTVSERLPNLKNLIYIGEHTPPGMFNFQDIMAMGDAITDAELDSRQQTLDQDDVINMQYTSGTTGFPKGVMLSHYNILNNAKFVAECMNFTPEDRLCFPVPLFHCFGCVMSTLACVTKGATMVPIEYFEAEKVLFTIQQEKCTALHGVPTMYIAELEVLKTKNYDLSSLRTGIMAGASCPIEVMREVAAKLGMKEITIAYGQTEASPVITQTRTQDSLELRVTTVGKALPGVEVKIVDPATGEEAPRGTQGELCARGFGLMKGYYNMPEATAAAIDHEGWLHTGDLATMDQNGYCNITGRLNDMIIRGGENIYPREVEEFLYTHPQIMDVQVVGVPSEKYGEEVMACIRVSAGVELTAEEVLAFCQDKISRHKIPKYIHFMDQFPTTASGKVQKYKLREMAIDMYDLHKAANQKMA